MLDFDAHRRTADTTAGTIGYVDVGEGPAALFVHGVATGAYLWRNVIDRLRGERRCVALDLPLHGTTPGRPGQDLSAGAMADLLEDLRAALGLTEVDLVGNDTGGAVAQIFAARHPNRVRTLTLTNCDIQDQALTEPLAQVAELVRTGSLAPFVVEALAGDLSALRSGFFARAYEHQELVSDETLRAYLTPLFHDLEAGRAFDLLDVPAKALELPPVTVDVRTAIRIDQAMYEVAQRVAALVALVVHLAVAPDL